LDPELLGIAARAINADSIILLFFVGQQRIDDDLRPLAVLEELECYKPLVKVLLFND
jgi:hypothetical protein